MTDNAMPSSDPASTADASGTSRDTIAPSASSARTRAAAERYMILMDVGKHTEVLLTDGTWVDVARSQKYPIRLFTRAEAKAYIAVDGYEETTQRVLFSEVA